MKATQAKNNQAKSIKEDLDREDNTSSERTGTFTTGIVSVREGIRIALFFSGHQHAGENLDDVLQHRSAQLSAPIQMPFYQKKLRRYRATFPRTLKRF